MSENAAANRAAWEAASQKYHREAADLTASAGRVDALVAVEHALLDPILASGPVVVHLQSGHGLDDVALLRAGARIVVGVDYSITACRTAADHARKLELPSSYVVGLLPSAAPIRAGCADLVYTGKGALMWIADLPAWARLVARLLRPGGHLCLYEAHPVSMLWTWEPDRVGVRGDRDYFADEMVNDTFPGHGAVEYQHTLSAIVTAVLGADLRILDLAEHAQPFWKPDGMDAAAWDGRLPNSFSLLAQRPLHGDAPAGS